MSVNPGAFSYLPLNKKGSCIAMISGLKDLILEEREINTGLLPQQLCWKILRVVCFRGLDCVGLNDRFLDGLGNIN
jgi:hypothetical protein